jgi:hypothetical protein
MFQHLVVQYTMKYQKYVTVSSYTVHDAASLYFRALQKHIPYDVGAAGMLVH